MGVKTVLTSSPPDKRVHTPILNSFAPSSRVRSRQQSKIANGSALFAGADHRSVWARRFGEILGQVLQDLGGRDAVSEAQLQLARRAATICVESERLEAQAAEGHEIDLDLFGTLTDRLGRTFARLGIRRQARDCTPSLGTYLDEAAE